MPTLCALRHYPPPHTHPPKHTRTHTLLHLVAIVLSPSLLPFGTAFVNECIHSAGHMVTHLPSFWLSLGVGLTFEGFSWHMDFDLAHNYVAIFKPDPAATSRKIWLKQQQESMLLPKTSEYSIESSYLSFILFIYFNFVFGWIEIVCGCARV